MGTMKRRFATALCAGCIAATTALASDVYVDFAKAGVFDPEMSNTQANELVSNGIRSGDPRLVRLTLEALAAHSGARSFGAAVVARDFAEVPQLKEFLIGHWRKRVAEGNFSREIGDFDAYTDRNPVTDEPHSVFVWSVGNGTDWVLIPAILAAVFPGDQDVHDLLWEYDSLSEDVPLDGWILGFFNQGGFKTPEVDRLRIESVGNDHRPPLYSPPKGSPCRNRKEGLGP